MTIEEFIEKCQRRSTPVNPMSRIKALARELAEGAVASLWPATFDGSYVVYEERRDFEPYALPMYKYIEARWGNLGLNDAWFSGWYFDMLKYNDYLRSAENNWIYTITKDAFALIEEADPATIFISYKRKESSEFALLIEDRLKAAGLSPFLDKQLQAGDDWHAELEDRIKSSDFFLLILGNETLKSEITVREIGWALKYKVSLIPIWHHEFVFHVSEWPDLPKAISDALANTHTIRVIEENPLTYDTALRELLNRFGVSA
jgi:hypothetical protein